MVFAAIARQSRPAARQGQVKSALCLLSTQLSMRSAHSRAVTQTRARGVNHRSVKPTEGVLSSSQRGNSSRVLPFRINSAAPFYGIVHANCHSTQQIIALVLQLV